MTTARLRWLALAAVAVGITAAAEPESGPGTGEFLKLSSDLGVVVRHGRQVELAVRAAAGEDYAALAGRHASAETAAAAAALAALNGKPTLGPGDWVRLPLELLSDRFRALVLLNLFPDDRPDGEDWLHAAGSGALPTYDEGLWQVAEWFAAGGGPSFEELMQANRLDSPELRRGQRVRVPAALLHPAFRSRPHSADGALEYGSDAQGAYGAYRLKAGEALYSAVVLRFTGRTAAEDVHTVAEELAQRSGIRDPRDIPVHYEVRIPLERLEPEFLPPDHPRRLAAEAERAEVAAELAREPVAETRRGLEGVLVILDPGHGGRDLGTINNGIWEHDYVYDVACRLRQKLERRSSAEVFMTLEDLKTGCAPSPGDRLVANHQGTIRTVPPFLAQEEGEAQIGVNLRWYLANSVYRRALDRGTAADRVVFVSLHADSRHASLRGLMVYVPGAGYRTKTYGDASETYVRYREVREQPHVHFSKKERLRSEAVSRELAKRIVASFRRDDLPVQPYQPVRDRVIRGDSEWVPAVLRGNAVPAKVLVEMLNLGNAEDAALLGSALERDRLAEALHQALRRYFGESSPAPARLAAAAAAP